jgi:hypothetical protein
MQEIALCSLLFLLTIACPPVQEFPYVCLLACLLVMTKEMERKGKRIIVQQ